MAKVKKGKTKKQSKPWTPPSGWHSTDADEIERRRARGAEESFEILPKPAGDAFYGTYRVNSGEGQGYRVEIRSLVEPVNSCECPDQRFNGLGTCKHIEAALHRLQHRRKRAFKAAAAEGSSSVEVFLDRRELRVRVRWSAKGRGKSRIAQLLAPFFDDEDCLVGEPLDTLPALQRALDGAGAAARRTVRVSDELPGWLESLDRREQQVRARRHFEAEVAAGRASFDVVKHPLYPYQQAGMLHLAFTGRALLADEMGLGKTVQAVAACELLRRSLGIQRVLVIAPASLKGEWQEQIAKFTDLSAQLVQGSRAERLRQYQRPGGFFMLANYEQIRPDVAEINATLAPDVIILDEAQRIKNWQTKTAAAIKRLHSAYAFVLTGTPIENRIDEIYSIVQFLDPAIFGPLFRFNRDFYRLDDKGRAVGYRNLDLLHQRLRSVMLRRRKGEVEGQLPGRTVNNYFVAMHQEQRWRYEEYETIVARLAHRARNRPLRPEEMQRLQSSLACMRMLCDTPYILDQDCRVSPKLQELGTILEELQTDGEHKIIVFSEWQRMLELVRDHLRDIGLDYAWHTGQVPQPLRRKEIRRFRQDEDCRVFLSTDSGAVGLNLQVADVVINLDLPWNPAKLEQRIARAWRKHQKRPVQVINLITEDSIEHRMVSLLEQKRSLAEGVVDGNGEAEMAMPSGRAAFLERVDALVGDRPEAQQVAPADPVAAFADSVRSQWADVLDRVELHGEADAKVLIAVAQRPDADLASALQAQLEAQFGDPTPQLQLLDRCAHAAMSQLIEAGVLRFSGGAVELLHEGPAEPAAADDTDAARARRQRQVDARARLEPGRRQLRMAQVLGDGGFATEALAPLREAVELALQSLLYWQGHDVERPVNLERVDATLVQAGLLASESLPAIEQLRDAAAPWEGAQAESLLSVGLNLFQGVDELLKAE